REPVSARRHVVDVKMASRVGLRLPGRVRGLWSRGVRLDLSRGERLDQRDCAEAGTIEHSCRARRALHTGSEIVPVTPLCGRRARTRTTTTVVTVKPIRMSRAPASVDAESRVPATRM